MHIKSLSTSSLQCVELQKDHTSEVLFVQNITQAFFFSEHRQYILAGSGKVIYKLKHLILDRMLSTFS